MKKENNQFEWTFKEFLKKYYLEIHKMFSYNIVKDTIEVHPRRIKSLDEVDCILNQIDYYANGKSAGVVLRQNMQFGGSLLTRTEEEYQNYLPGNGRREFYCKYWSRSYFEDLREKLISEQRKEKMKKEKRK